MRFFSKMNGIIGTSSQQAIIYQWLTANKVSAEILSICRYYVYSKMEGTLLKQHRHVGVEKDYWKLTFGV